jgi:hypothetical protein
MVLDALITMADCFQFLLGHECHVRWETGVLRLIECDTIALTNVAQDWPSS